MWFRPHHSHPPPPPSQWPLPSHPWVMHVLLPSWVCIIYTFPLQSLHLTSHHSTVSHTRKLRYHAFVLNFSYMWFLFIMYTPSSLSSLPVPSLPGPSLPGPSTGTQQSADTAHLRGATATTTVQVKTLLIEFGVLIVSNTDESNISPLGAYFHCWESWSTLHPGKKLWRKMIICNCLMCLQHALVRQPPDFSLCLPGEWREVMTKGDQQWIGRVVFKGRNQVGDNSPSQLWWHPPTKKDLSTKPQPDTYMLRRFFLWMPWRAWVVDFRCPHCGPERSLQ